MAESDADMTCLTNSTLLLLACIRKFIDKQMVGALHSNAAAVADSVSKRL